MNGKDVFEISKWIVCFVSWIHWTLFKWMSHNPRENQIDNEILELCLNFEYCQIQVLEKVREEMRVFHRRAALRGWCRSKRSIARHNYKLEVWQEYLLQELADSRDKKIKMLLLERSGLGQPVAWNEFLLRYGKGRPYLLEIQL